MPPGCDLWDTIAIVIALDSLHDDFDTTTASLLETGDKTIDQIQSILQWKEAKLISKRTTGAVGDLAMTFKDNGTLKRKTNSNEECFNCHNLGHFGRDCPLPDKRLNRTQDSRSQRGGNGGGQSRGRSSNRSDSRARKSQSKDNIKSGIDMGPNR